MQSTQGPAEPQDVGFVPGMHVLPSQQKPAPQAAPVHVAVHAPLVHVGVPPLHWEQAPPVLPQLPLSVPGWHIVPSQQPPWHGRPPAQLGEHWWLIGLHACPRGQSAGPLHPGGASAPSAPGPSEGPSIPSGPSMRVSATKRSEGPSSVESGPPPPSPPSMHAPVHVPWESTPHPATASPSPRLHHAHKNRGPRPPPVQRAATGSA